MRDNNILTWSPNQIFYAKHLKKKTFLGNSYSQIYFSKHNLSCLLQPNRFHSCALNVPWARSVRGPGDVGRGLDSQKSPKYPPKCSVRKLFTFLWHVLEMFENMSKNVLKPCYHIEFDTTNPNTKLQFLLHNNRKHQSISEILKSKSTVYPQKQTRTDVSRHASGA